MTMLEDKIWQALSEIYDPEIPVNIIDLGLVYSIKETGSDAVHIRMTVTSKHCPAAAFLPEIVRQAAVKAGAENTIVELVFEPLWSRDRMSDKARKTLGYRT